MLTGLTLLKLPLPRVRVGLSKAFNPKGFDDGERHLAGLYPETSFVFSKPRVEDISESGIGGPRNATDFQLERDHYEKSPS